MDKYNKLTVLRTWKKKRKTNGYREIAECLCDCGKHTSVHLENLKSGHTTSCGCAKIKAITKHGYSGHPAYHIWEAIVDRCYNPNNSGYKWYGGKGIKMCDQWRNDPGLFVEWALSHGYKKGLSIERADNSRNYEPDNCSWIPYNQQQKNTSKSLKLSMNGETDTRRGWAKRYGVDHLTIKYRMVTKGQTLEQALGLI